MAHIQPQQLETYHRPVLRDTGIPSVTGTGQFQVQREDVPPTVGNGAAQGTLWNPPHTNVVNYGTADYPEHASDLASPYTHPNIGPAHGQGIPEHMQIMFHENPRNDYLGRVPEDVVPGPSQAAFAYLSTHQAPNLGQPAAENLRRLAARYIHHPDSQVDMVQMEPGSAGRYKVVIVLEMTDFL